MNAVRAGLVLVLIAAPLAHVAASPITSRAQLDAWLAQPPAANPLAALSPGARERFLCSLSFGPGGLSGMSAGDLADELSDAQIRAVFELFGPAVLAYAPRSHADEVRPFDRRAPGKPPIADIEREYNAFFCATHLGEPGSTARARLVGDSFDSRLAGLYTSTTLKRADDHELRLLRLAARQVALETRLPPHVAAFERVFAERTRRRLVSSDDVASMRNLYLALHRFPEARRLGSEYRSAGLAPLPQFRDTLGDAAGLATVWRLDESGRKLERAAVDLSPLQIFVTAACHLSKDAARDIAADATLGPVFARHAQWLVQAPGIESVDDARDWNRELPRSPVAMIYDRKEWSVLPEWTMPRFYVVRDGRVLDSFDGWRAGDARQRAGLVAVLERHGLLAP